MRPAQVVERDVQAHRRAMRLQLFRKAVAETREAFAGLPQRQMRPLNVARADLRRHTAHYVASYRYYLRGTVSVRSLRYVQVHYATGFGDRAVRDAITERRTDRQLVRMEAIRGERGRQTEAASLAIPTGELALWGSHVELPGLTYGCVSPIQHV